MLFWLPLVSAFTWQINLNQSTSVLFECSRGETGRMAILHCTAPFEGIPSHLLPPAFEECGSFIMAQQAEATATPVVDDTSSPEPEEAKAASSGWSLATFELMNLLVMATSGGVYWWRRHLQQKQEYERVRRMA
ncbi:hypothetical protein HDV03_000668 [Kappamyces sp. JEL0829]|nr:hypothetical protein HDV03_000668 [Kappamyces sp. JEL0829]